MLLCVWEWQYLGKELGKKTENTHKGLAVLMKPIELFESELRLVTICVFQILKQLLEVFKSILDKLRQGKYGFIKCSIKISKCWWNKIMNKEQGQQSKDRNKHVRCQSSCKRALISLNISCLVQPRMRRADFKKQVSTKYQQETHFTYKGENRLKVTK